MKILVTGGAGFIGSHLVEKLLADGHQITVLDDFNDFYDPAVKHANLAPFRSHVELLTLDLRDGPAIRREVEAGKFEAIIHLAARAGVRPSLLDPQLYLDTNISGTLHLLEAARHSGVGTFVLASSSSVYGVCKTAPFSEKMPLLRTISPYAATKLSCEQFGSNYAHLYGLRVHCLRFFTVYGPRQRPDLAIHGFTRKIWNGQPIQQFGDGSTARDYTYISDIVAGIVASLHYRGPDPFEIFNLGGHRTTTLSELIALIELSLGKKATIQQLPEQPGDVPLTYADISKSRRLLGYDPQTPITEGIPKFVEWFLGMQKK